MKNIKLLFAIIFSCAAPVWGAWDKAEGMQRHARNKGGASTILVLLLFAVPLLYFIYSIIITAIQKKKKK